MNKMDKALEVVMALYNLKDIPKKGSTRWKDAQRIARKPQRVVDYQWKKARRVLNQREGASHGEKV